MDSRGCPQCHASAPANLQPFYHECRDAQDPSCANSAHHGSLWRYAKHLPLPVSGVVSLGEGLTPLVSAERMGMELDVPQLLIKNEGCNPTWSHKDRFSTVAVSLARSQGAKVVATASSGNAGASLAAYAAAAGLACVVTTFAGAAGAMIQQIRAYGAVAVPMLQKADRWKFLEKAAAEHDWFIASPYHHPVVGSHPAGIEGYKTIAYEIVDQSAGHVPDWCVLPVCYGDALAGVSTGFRELYEAGRIARLPRLVAAEVHGSLTAALESGLDRIEEQDAHFETVALSIGTTRSTYQALKAIRDTRGRAVSVSNDALFDMQRVLAAREGIFAELASVAPFVAIGRLRQEGLIQRDDRVVAIVTASGLKDLDVSAGVHAQQRSFDDVDAAWRWARERGGLEKVLPAMADAL